MSGEALAGLKEEEKRKEGERKTYRAGLGGGVGRTLLLLLLLFFVVCDGREVNDYGRFQQNAQYYVVLICLDIELQVPPAALGA